MSAGYIIASFVAFAERGPALSHVFGSFWKWVFIDILSGCGIWGIVFFFKLHPNSIQLNLNQEKEIQPQSDDSVLDSYAGRVDDSTTWAQSDTWTPAQKVGEKVSCLGDCGELLSPPGLPKKTLRNNISTETDFSESWDSSEGESPPPSFGKKK